MTSSQQILEREERLALPAAIAAVAGFVLVFALPLVTTNAILDGSGDAAFLRSIDESSGPYLATQIGVAIGFLLVIAPLAYLFEAMVARSASGRRGLLGAVVAAPILLAASTIAMTLVSLEAASEFVASGIEGEGDQANEAARDLRSEQGTGFSVAIGLVTAGRIGFAFALAYTAYQSMKVGLLTRFWGSLGAAVGAASVLFLEFAIAWFVFLGLLIAGWIPGGRPPAWEAGEAIPWPGPGEEDESDEDEAAEPLGEPPLEAPWDSEPEYRESREMEYRDPGEEAGPTAGDEEPGEPPAPAPSRSGPRRKRKRRG